MRGGSPIELPVSLPASLPVLVIISVVIVSVVAWASDAVMRATILSPWRVRQRGEVHRLLTAGWVHADTGHLAVNMFTLYFFAERVAATLGAIWFVILYVSAVVAAYVPTTLRRMGNPKYASLGASGAVSAVMFSAILLNPALSLNLLFLPVAIPAPLYAVAYLAYSAWRSFSAGKDRINHDAHFAGALYGVAFTFVLEPARAIHSVTHLF